MSANIVEEGRPSDLEEALEMRRQCPQFRILIVGKANAGKTTILEKVCRAKQGEKPTVRGRGGKKIWFKGGFDVLKPSASRGEHNVEYEISYEGSNFIFHDSSGFEAGSEREVERLKRFLAEKSNEHDLKSQLHAIWYCVPLDDPRSPLPKEMEFFEHETGHVPVVVVFTKYDALFKEFLGAAGSPKNYEQARKHAEECAQEVIQSKATSFFNKAAHPPRAFIHLHDMHKPEQECPELTERTAEVIDNAALRNLFISVQKNNLLLSIKSVLEAILPKAEGAWDQDATTLCLSYFAHFWEMDNSQKPGTRKRMETKYRDDALLDLAIHEAITPVLTVLQDGVGITGCAVNHHLITAVLIMAEHCSWNPQRYFEDRWGSTTQKYQQGHVIRIKDKLNQSYADIEPRSNKEVKEWLFNFIKDNLLPH